MSGKKSEPDKYFAFGREFDDPEAASKWERECRIEEWRKCLLGSGVKLTEPQLLKLSAYLADEHEFVYEY